ncbi:MAG: hypothetical protein R2911_34915 [Caldilineaceae bacterium]
MTGPMQSLAQILIVLLLTAAATTRLPCKPKTDRLNKSGFADTVLTTEQHNRAMKIAQGQRLQVKSTLTTINTEILKVAC